MKYEYDTGLNILAQLFIFCVFPCCIFQPFGYYASAMEFILVMIQSVDQLRYLYWKLLDSTKPSDTNLAYAFILFTVAQFGSFGIIDVRFVEID